ARGLKDTTRVIRQSAAALLVCFLGHDDATRVTPEDILRFKDHRLAKVHPRTANSNIMGLKVIFGWAVANRKLPTNPATGITIKLGKPVKLRSKGFTEEEARAILTASINYHPGDASSARSGRREIPQTVAAKRWVPWLCAYTGAR